MKPEEALTIFLQNLAARTKKETGYPPTLFCTMLSDKGGLQTARDLINKSKPSSGYTALWEKGRLDLTVEAQILENENEEWHDLFTRQELENCRKRLQQYDYQGKK